MNINMKRNSSAYLVTAFVSIFSTAVLAYDEPPVNLGQTSFLDGAPPAGPGLYFQDYLKFYTSNRFNDNNGNKLPLPQTKLHTTVNLAQLIYLSPEKCFDTGSFGLSAILPWLVEAHVKDGLGNSVLKARDGLGDINIGPFFQFDPIMGCDGPRFVHRIELDFILPNGRYNRNYAINPGSHFWSFNPYWAATVWFCPQWSASTRIHYLWNAKNTDPNVSFGPTATSTKAGQAVFANLAMEYEVITDFRLGLNGYVFKQVTDTLMNKHKVAGRRERVWAIGPGLLRSFSKDDSLFLNVYFERNARNRPQGSTYQVRYVHHF